MKRLALAALVILILTAGCGRPTDTGAEKDSWIRIAAAQGTASATGNGTEFSTGQAVATLSSQPARLVVDVKNVIGDGTTFYLVPKTWIDSRPVRTSENPAYPESFLVGTVDAEGRTILDLPHEPGEYVLIPKGGMQRSGTTFEAVIEELQ